MTDVSTPQAALTSTSTGKPVSPFITSYDLIKAFAVIIMIIDHTGHYFFPDDNWWRAVGRIGFPVWFFLVGYSSGRSIPRILWGGAVFLLGMNLVTGMDLLPLNALFTIILIRLLIDKLMIPVLERKISIWIISAGLFILVFPTLMLTEYGTQAMITAIFGYVVRHRAKFAAIHKDLPFWYMLFALISFVFTQQFVYLFDNIQLGFVLFGTLVVRYFLYNFKAQDFPDLNAKLPRPISFAIEFMGRRTLEIYVVHLTLFKLAAPYFLSEPINWFHFVLTSSSF